MSEGFRCLACGAAIRWELTMAGRWMPVEAGGTPHWATCPAADRLRRKPSRFRRATSASQLSFLPPAPVQGEFAERNAGVEDVS